MFFYRKRNLLLCPREYARAGGQARAKGAHGQLVARVQAAGADAGCEGIVINPGGYSHYSIALADALRAVDTPAIEVHISNIHAREGYRATTVTGAACRGVIAGLGLDGYRLAVEALARKSEG